MFFKRHRMEMPLRGPLTSPALPNGFTWWSWQPSLLQVHGLVKFEAFADQEDARLFPNLGTLVGCVELMKAITEKPTFCPQATWLLVRREAVIGTIQGVAERKFGAIQNVGLLPAFRGIGLGELLVKQCLAGFYSVGVRIVSLEVTANNRNALNLYRRVGFRKATSFYKPDPSEPPELASTDDLLAGAGI
ncbi:MAG: GNAT family N-acetyltransferase [Fimbriiglobus sp.]